VKLLVALSLALAACAPAAAVGPTNPPIITARPPLECAPSSDFCYPRVWIEMTIVPVASTDATSDSGSGLQEITNVTFATFLGAHASTAFGAIVQWRAGDQVRVHGRWYTVFGAVTVHCGDPITPASTPPAALHMMTSLDAYPCAQHENLEVLAN
jgi:hypothetical protein